MSIAYLPLMAKADPHQSLHTICYDFTLRDSEHSEDDDGATALEPIQRLLRAYKTVRRYKEDQKPASTRTVNLPQLRHNVIVDVALFHQLAHHLLKASQLS